MPTLPLIYAFAAKCSITAELKLIHNELKKENQYLIYEKYVNNEINIIVKHINTHIHTDFCESACYILMIMCINLYFQLFFKLL